jgi:methionyl aminopeptidase
MHQDPHVLNYRTREHGPRMRPGLCLAIEPMLTLGDPATRVLADEWTVVTADGSRAAHWEHSVALLDGGVWVLTARDGGAAKLGELNIPVTAARRLTGRYGRARAPRWGGEGPHRADFVGTLVVA